MVRVINEFGGEDMALILFVVQLALNAPWSYLFFGLHRPDVAFYDIIAL
jgi:tryptophan-rich sensory protein